MLGALLLVAGAQAAERPILSLNWQWGGSITSTAVTSQRAYVAVGPRLVVFDLGDPNNPVELGRSAPVHASIVRAVVQGDYVYAIGGAYSAGSLWVFDVHDPAAPTLMAQLAQPDPWDLVIGGNYVYVAGWLDGHVGVIDISNPMAPQEVGAYSPGGGCLALAYPRLFVGRGSNGYLRMLDVSNPAVPVLLDSVSQSATSVAVQGNYVYALTGAYQATFPDLIVYEIHGSSLWQAGTWVDPQIAAPMFGPSLCFAGGCLYVCTASVPGIAVLNVSDPAHPVLGGSPAGLDWACELDLTETTPYATIRYGDARLAKLDLSSPTAPAETASVPLADSCGPIVPFDGGLLALSHTLHVLSVDDPNGPTAIGEYPGRYSAVDLLPPDECVVVDANGLYVLSMTDPAVPSLVGSVLTPLPSSSYGLPTMVWNDRAYVGCYSYPSELRIFGLATPAAPLELGTFTSTASIGGLAHDASYAYMATTSGLKVLDVQDPANVVEVGSAGGAMVGLGIYEGYAYVSENLLTRVYDLADPAAPVLAASTSIYETRVFAAHANYLLVARQRGGPVLLDVALPRAPVVVATCPVPDFGISPAVDGTSLYLAGSDGGLWCLNLWLPGDFEPDGDIDGGDALRLAACLSGPDQTEPPSGLDEDFSLSDLDRDDDVDLADYLGLQRHATGAL